MDAATLVSNPAAFKEAARQAGLLPGTQPNPPRLEAHAKGVCGIYGLMIVVCLWSFAVRWRKGRLWFVQRNRVGVYRPNAAVWVPIFLMIYSALWIGLIMISIEGDRTKPISTYSTLIFVPLSFAGWTQVYGTVSAIPWRTGIIKLNANDPVYRSRTSRILESQLVRNVLLFLVPLTYLVVLVIPAVGIGRAQVDMYYEAMDLLVEVDQAIEQGWSPAGLSRALKAGKRVTDSNADSNKCFRWSAIVIEVWIVLDMSIYLPAAVTVWRLITRQIEQLQRSLSNATTLKNLSQDFATPQLSSAAATIDSVEHYQAREVVPPRHRTTSSMSSDQAAHVLEYEYQLHRLVQFRRVFTLQACTTFYTGICAIAYASYSIARSVVYIPAHVARDMGLFFPVYAVMLPAAIPTTIITTLLFIQRNASRPRTPPPTSAPVSPPSTLATSTQGDTRSSNTFPPQSISNSNSSAGSSGGGRVVRLDFSKSARVFDERLEKSSNEVVGGGSMMPSQWAKEAEKRRDGDQWDRLA